MYVSAWCQASQKLVSYNCFVALEENGTIIAGHCDCPIGYVIC